MKNNTPKKKKNSLQRNKTGERNSRTTRCESRKWEEEEKIERRENTDLESSQATKMEEILPWLKNGGIPEIKD